MIGGSRKWTVDQLLGLVLLAIAAVECAIAWSLAPDDRPTAVNFGLGFAGAAGLLAAVSIAMIAAARAEPARGGPHPFVRVVGVLLLFPVAGLLLLVAAGILEEIR